VNLPNQLSLARILAAPVVLVLMLKGQPVPAFWLYVATALTDGVDGLAARMLKQETKLGALLDPLADKVLMVTVYPGLVVTGLLESWILAVFISRDLVIILGWALTYILLGETQPKTRWLGKISTASQMLLATSVLLNAAYPGLARSYGIGRDLLPAVAVALTVASMVDYLVIGSRRLGSAS
jgi:cardiolipin synthase